MCLLAEQVAAEKRGVIVGGQVLTPQASPHEQLALVPAVGAASRDWPCLGGACRPCGFLWGFWPACSLGWSPALGSPGPGVTYGYQHIRSLFAFLVLGICAQGPGGSAVC